MRNLILLLFLLALIISAQTNNLPENSGIKFERISIEQGLSHSTVFSVCQDSTGYIWFGTIDGLNRYDGYKFTKYFSRSQDSSSISHNTIFSLFTDSRGTLWVGTLGGGLNCYDFITDSFTNFSFNPDNSESLSDNNVRTIFEDSDGTLWIGTQNGLNRFNAANKSFTRYYSTESKTSLSNNYIWSVYEDKSGFLWIGTYGGLNKLDKKNNTFFSFRHDPNNPESISNDYIWSITADKFGRLWLGTNNGISVFDPVSEKAERIKTGKGRLSSRNVWEIYIDKTGQLWCGTLGGGINHAHTIPENLDDIQFDYYWHNNLDSRSISHNYVWSILEDNAGNIWVGSDLGINKINYSAHKFVHIKNNPLLSNSLSNNEVKAVLRDNKGTIWIGTRFGLNMYNPATGRFRLLTHKSGKNSIGNNFIRTIYEDSFGTIWIGTDGGGLNKLNPNSGKFTNYVNSTVSGTIPSNNVTAILEDKKGYYWIGTLSGLNYFDEEKEYFRFYKNNPLAINTISHDYISTIYNDSEGTLWIGTLGGGLNRFISEEKGFVSYQSQGSSFRKLSNNYVYDIYQDSKERLWIGTNNGLNVYSKSNDSFEVYNFGNDEISNVIYGILEDEHGNLWISSTKGLYSLNPENGHIKFFDTGDGLQSNQFNETARFRDSDGNMYFGGINGLNIFHPDSLIENNFIPPVLITDFQLLNKQESEYTQGELRKKIFSDKEINLSYKHNSFTIEFASLDYTAPAKNKYKFQLKGFDEEWRTPGEDKQVTYSNLPPDEYEFVVLGSNSDNKWNTTGTSLLISVTPPFWTTWWFITFVLLAIFGVVAIFFYNQISHLLEIERLRIKIAQDLHDDIGTRLTEISMLSDYVFHTYDKAEKNHKDNIHNIGSIARTLIDNMSDIVWLINPKRDSLYELFLKLKDTYEDLLSHNEIYLNINNFSFLQKIRLPMDYRKNLYLIFKEALNNSIKHSNCSEISINAQLNGKDLDITLYDNGKGFNVEAKKSGSGLENMYRRAEHIGGNLRVQSSESNGTMIKFTGIIRERERSEEI